MPKHGLLYFVHFCGYKEATVADIWDDSGMEGVWIPCFLRHLNDWEFEELERFLKFQGKKVVMGKEDALALKETKNGITVKAFSELLDSSYTSPFPSLIWNSFVPSKVGIFFFFFAWDPIVKYLASGPDQETRSSFSQLMLPLQAAGTNCRPSPCALP